MKLEEMQKIWALMLTKHTSFNRRREALSAKELFSQKCVCLYIYKNIKKYRYIHKYIYLYRYIYRHTHTFFYSGPLVFNFITPVE